jgi:uncharacterized protein
MKAKKKILFEVLHPAHVHLFKNLIIYLNQKGVNLLVVSREKDITNQLLEYYEIPFVNISRAGTGVFGLLSEALTRDYRMLHLLIKHKIDIAFTSGTSFAAAHASVFTGTKTYNFIEDDDDVINLYARLTYPVTSFIVVPDCLRYKRFTKKRIFYQSYHELAYLHPNNFTPDEKILEQYGLKKGRFVILRLSALKAHHDFGAKGIDTGLKKQITELLSGYDVVESLEGKSGNKIKPWDMHHVMAFAKMIVCDSQTMTVEAAVLGVPAVRINSFIGKSSVIDELENNYKLSYGFFPDNHKLINETIKYLSSEPEVRDVWQQRRQKLLSEKIDLNEWMVRFYESLMAKA